MGSLYDSLEYFIKIYENNKDVHLVFHLLSRGGVINDKEMYKRNHKNPEKIFSQIKKILDGKYFIDDYSFFDNIHIVDLYRFFFTTQLNKILTIDLATPGKFKNFIANGKEILIIPEWTSYQYFYQSKVNKVTYYTEMPFCHCDVPYRMKFDFERCKPVDTFKDKLYINYPQLNPFKVLKISDEINKVNKEILVKEDNFFYDLHFHFNEYMYFQSDAWFDPHPKLFHECKYYNKPYHYFNWKNVKDGAYYRYHMSLDDKLSDLQLTNDDIIIKKMSYE